MLQNFLAKYLQDKTCKIKQMQNIPLTLRTFLNKKKNVLGKSRTQEDSSNTTTSKVLGKICNTTFPWVKVL